MKQNPQKETDTHERGKTIQSFQGRKKRDAPARPGIAGELLAPGRFCTHVEPRLAPSDAHGQRRSRKKPLLALFSQGQGQEGGRLLLPSRRKEKIHCRTATVWILLFRGILMGANSTFMLTESSAGGTELPAPAPAAAPARCAPLCRGPGRAGRAPPAAGAAHGRGSGRRGRGGGAARPDRGKPDPGAGAGRARARLRGLAAATPPLPTGGWSGSPGPERRACHRSA